MRPVALFTFALLASSSLALCACGAAADADTAGACPAEPPADACAEPPPEGCVFVVDGCPTKFDGCHESLPESDRVADWDPAMSAGEPCDEPGKVCSYYEPPPEHDVVVTQKMVCSPEGTWKDGSSICTSGDMQCPFEAPQPGQACDDACLSSCSYPSPEPSCEGQSVVFECQGGAWVQATSECG